MEKRLVLKNEISEINKLAIFIEELGEELKLTPDLVFNLNMVLEEAVSNVILYASKAKKGTKVSPVIKDGKKKRRSKKI